MLIIIFDYEKDQLDLPKPAIARAFFLLDLSNAMASNRRTTACPIFFVIAGLTRNPSLRSQRCVEFKPLSACSLFGVLWIAGEARNDRGGKDASRMNGVLAFLCKIPRLRRLNVRMQLLF